MVWTAVNCWRKLRSFCKAQQKRRSKKSPLKSNRLKRAFFNFRFFLFREIPAESPVSSSNSRPSTMTAATSPPQSPLMPKPPFSPVHMLLLKFIQSLPVVGMIGGMGNPVYYHKVMKYAGLKYRKRYLCGLERRCQEEERKQICPPQHRCVPEHVLSASPHPLFPIIWLKGTIVRKNPKILHETYR